MNPLFITSLIGIVLAVLSLGQISPSVSSQITARSIEAGVARENALLQQIIRYRGVEGAYPASPTDLINKNYWNSANNDNGFGGSYSFNVDAARGVVTINTTIADATKRNQYVTSYKHIFRPVDMGSGVVATTFILPSSGAIGAPVSNSGSIPASATAPDATTNTYWYDTSSGVAILNVSNGSIWAPAGSTGGGGASASVPSGAVMFFNLANCPSGWLAANGLNGTVDLRGEFIRGLDSGRGVDSGRTLASFQNYLTAAIPDVWLWAGSEYYGGYAGGGSYSGRGSTQNRPPGWPQGNETRPRNVALLPCIKQ